MPKCSKREKLRLEMLALLDEPGFGPSEKKKLDILAERFFDEWNKEESKIANKRKNK